MDCIPPNLKKRLVSAAAGGERKPSRRLSEEIAGLLEVFAERSVTINEVMAILKGRAYTLLLILLALPFCTPVPLPGVSTPFGLAILLIGFRLALRQKPWLPRRLLHTNLPPQFFARLLGATRRLVRGLELFLRPRWDFLFDSKLVQHGYGVILCVSGFLLLLPLPIPFSNGAPAITVVLIACAILERDGYCFVAGLAAFILTLAFFGALLWGGGEMVGWLQEQVVALFGRKVEVDE